jgi:transcriptional regulator with XRE-family HTH domain
MTSSSKIGRTLRAARERLGWSRETLAHHSGVSWSAIAQIESGRRRDVRLKSLSALATALGVSVDHLVGNSAPVPPLFEHRVLTYGSDEEYTATAIPFLDEGIERSESVLAVTTEAQAELLRDELRDGSRGVEFADPADWYRSPRDAIAHYRAFLEDTLEAGASWIRVVAEIRLRGRSAAEIASWTRYESIVNIAFAASPATIVCSYDERTWPEQTISDARRTHPLVARGSRATPNPEYRDPADLLLDLPIADR